jgi:hypothetical protein
VVQDDETLDLRGDEEADTSNGGLPSKHRDPSCVTVSIAGRILLALIYLASKC